MTSKKNSINLFLVRHAESLKNLNKRHGATSDKNELTTKGIEDVQLLRDLLIKNNISTQNVYCSSSEASIQTARILGNLDISQDKIKNHLRSLNMGIFSNLSFEEMKKCNRIFYRQIELYENGLFHPKYFDIPGFESLENFEGRIREVFYDIINCSCDDIIIVGHRSSLTMILNLINNKEEFASNAYYKKFNIPSLGVSHIEINKSKVADSIIKIVGVKPSEYFLEDITLGINYGTHDSSIALFSNNKLLFAAEEERFNREKKTESFPNKAIDHIKKKYFLQKKHISIANANSLIEFNDVENKNDRLAMFNKVLNTKKLISDEFTNNSFFSFPHHLCHASSAFYSSNFIKSLILTIDGIGEKQTLGAYIGDNNNVELVEKSEFPNSIGKVYGAICRFLGFNSGIKEGKVMALSSYGSPIYIEKFREFFIWNNGSVFPKVNSSYFNLSNDSKKPSLVSELFIARFGEPRPHDIPIRKSDKDIASSIQLLLEETIEKIANLLFEKYNIDRLCLSGGVALNCKANSHLIEKSKYKNIFIPPYPNDGGLAIGAAILKCSENYTSFKNLNTPYLGYNTDKSKLVDVIESFNLPYIKLNDVYMTASNILKNKLILGWHYGKAEFGPRALGNRSILADPRNKHMKEKINSVIKERESFRPFAAIVLEKHVDEVFSNSFSSPFMSFTFKVRNEWRTKVPAIVHIDNTSRIQTINEKQNNNIYHLLNLFYKKTGIPLLLNTSFNVNYAPIVNNEYDSLKTYISSGIDFLIIEGYLVAKTYEDIDIYSIGQ